MCGLMTTWRPAHHRVIVKSIKLAMRYNVLEWLRLQQMNLVGRCTYFFSCCRRPTAVGRTDIAHGPMLHVHAICVRANDKRNCIEYHINNINFRIFARSYFTEQRQTTGESFYNTKKAAATSDRKSVINKWKCPWRKLENTRCGW